MNNPTKLDRTHRPAVAGGVENDINFRDLLESYHAQPQNSYEQEDAEKLLIAHINALIAQAAPSGEAVLYARLIDMERNDERGVLTYRDAEEDWWVPLYTHPAPRDVDAPIVLPEKPKAQCLLPGVYAHTDATLDIYATAAVQNDRAAWKETK